MKWWGEVHKWVFEEGTAPVGEYKVAYGAIGDNVTELFGLTEKNLRFVGKALDSAGYNNYTVHQAIRT